MMYSFLQNVITHSLMLQFKQKAIFLQVPLPMFMFSNKTVTEARSNPASFPPIIIWIGWTKYSEDLGH